MRRSEFTERAEEVFGAGYADSVVADVVIGALGERTAARALDDGVPVSEVWAALCEVMDVPPARRWGMRRRQAPRGSG